MVLVTDISDNGLYIKDGESGFLVPPDNAEAMFDKIIYIVKNNEELRDSIIENARKTSEQNFDYKLYSEKLSFFLISKS